MLMMTLIVIAGILLLVMAGFGTFWLLVQLGVIAQKAMEPPTTDNGTYGLEQGRDIGKSE
jgi:hypothetical protein